jgi:hypothetical protein
MTEGRVNNRFRTLGYLDGYVARPKRPKRETPHCVRCDGPLSDPTALRCASCEADAHDEARKAVGL